MSKYMDRKFRREFGDGCKFWTGEDGMLVSLVIVRRPDWATALSNNFNHLFDDREKFDPRRGRERFAYRAPTEDGDWPELRKVWRVRDEPTPYPVIEYELEIPR